MDMKCGDDTPTPQSRLLGERGIEKEREGGGGERGDSRDHAHL